MAINISSFQVFKLSDKKGFRLIVADPFSINGCLLDVQQIYTLVLETKNSKLRKEE